MIYRKSDKGQQEIETRSAGLSPLLRRVLIMVDGESSVQQLAEKMMQDVSAELQQLATDGYITSGDGEPSAAGLKQELIATAQALLGKHAERVVQKLSSAPDDLAGLKAAVEDCQKFVRLFIDEKQAAVLFEQCRAVFGKYS